MIIEQAMPSDAAEILALQKLAYVSEAEIYNDFNIEPLVQSLEDLQSQFADHVFFKAVFAGAIIGSVRGKAKGDTCCIGKLLVHPKHQNKGVGKQLLAEIESAFNTCWRYELFTGSQSNKNIGLYEKAGYEKFKTVTISPNLAMIFLEKTKHG